MFVDAVNGDDANDGLSTSTAKKSLAAGLAAATIQGGDQIVRLIGDGVKYREGIDYFYNNPALTSLKVKGYKTDRPIISGAEQLSGWVACSPADATVVGANCAKRLQVHGQRI